MVLYANVVVNIQNFQGEQCSMNLENLKYWIDKDGNKVYGNPKKYNKSLEYLISDNPEDVVSKHGIRIRKIFKQV